MTLAAALGAFASRTTSRDIPARAWSIASDGFVDCFGVMIAARNEAAVRILREVLSPATGPASLALSSERVQAPEAAMINGVAAHALDFDDVAQRGHPSTVLVPAILAEAEAIDATGDGMLRAYAIGYETWAELVRRERGVHHEKGWHPTGVFGAVASAAACASLHQLEPVRSAHAIAIAASQASGVMANFGSMVKPFHAGRAAHSGILATRLAKAGFCASLDALEHPQGFLCAISPDGDVDLTVDAPNLGKNWRIEIDGLSVKRYPTCYCSHRSIDAMLDLLSKRPVRSDDIADITVTMSEKHATILRVHRPEAALAAKFSIEFAMSAAVVARAVGLAQLSDEFVTRPDVQSLINRVRVRPTQELDPEMPGAAPFDEVELRLKSGEVITSAKVRRPRGHTSRPLSDEELFQKFQDCLFTGRVNMAAERVYAHLRNIRHLTARQLATLP